MEEKMGVTFEEHIQSELDRFMKSGNTNIHELVKTSVDKAISDAITNAVNEAVKNNLNNDINDLVKNAFSHSINEYIDVQKKEISRIKNIKK